MSIQYYSIDFLLLFTNYIVIITVFQCTTVYFIFLFMIER
ncbi:hypothetical protein HMPREF3196_01357 [Bifidobacterium bifidum]|uniref:Uncharacterized protein n=1 Tax=Bifidobacterium bifidum TaxID=1681 RepID=A0A133KMM9_BIFBI|nr:hypothetical protein BIFBIF_01431 [Bifidobacterium bifidum ATCC 29521 = JCM 1255 = DSM 20456]KWZ80949.1 hypothetical protein HMPREF3196_01357 [Bifidobacterium bifidum]